MPLEIIKRDITKIKVDYVVDTLSIFKNEIKHNPIINPTQEIQNVYLKSLKNAVELNKKSVALTLIKNKNTDLIQINTLKIATDAIKEFLHNNEIEVFLITSDKEDLNFPKELEENIEKYLFKHHLSLDKDHKTFTKRKKPFLSKPSPVTKDEVALYSEKCSFDCEESLKELPTIANKNILDQYKEDESFNQCLRRHIYKKRLIEKDVYNAANLTKQAFNGIYNEKKTPKKGNALALAIGLRLNIEETIDFIEKAGYSFGRTKQDYIVRYFIENGVYDIFEINCFLLKYDLPYLGSGYK